MSRQAGLLMLPVRGRRTGDIMEPRDKLADGCSLARVDESAIRPFGDSAIRPSDEEEEKKGRRLGIEKRRLGEPINFVRRALPRATHLHARRKAKARCVSERRPFWLKEETETGASWRRKRARRQKARVHLKI